MVRRIILIICLSILCFTSNGQLPKIVGIWKFEIDEQVFKVFNEESYMIFGELNNYLTINCLSDKNFSLSINRFCFTKSKNDEGCKDCVSKFDLNENKYICLGSGGDPSGIEFSDDEKSMVLTNLNEFYYSKVEKLPNKYLNFLFNQSKKDKKNYIQEFLSVNYKLITNKTYIYSSKNTSTQMYLLQNDPVEVVAEKSNWIKIKYYPEKNGEWTGKTIEGWIKRSDVE